MRIRMLAVFSALLIGALLRGGGETGPVSRLADGVYYWQGNRENQEQTNVGWVVFRDYVLVIDANFPWGARKILPEIRKTTDRPIRIVFNTHYHADHSYGNSVFVDAGATVLATEDCAAESRAKGPADVQNQTKSPPERMEHPAILFRDRLAIDDGTHRVEFIRLGPAHSKGDAVAWLPGQGIVFAGDLAVNWTRGNNLSDPDADYDNWIRALDELVRWQPRVVIPGHGTPGGLATLQGQRGYLSEIWTRVRSGRAAGKTPEQILETVQVTAYQPFAADPARVAGAVRTMYRNAPRQERLRP
jgi:glyoxylase-like metal-dependent hydrolase (beta-lactamase superfamily II)